ncbi:MAG TPA: hypothetical protein VLC10_05330 [Patescibacteria group bacterium]|nr:hypothetical protein [Patescibacteria group bacterium]
MDRGKGQRKSVSSGELKSLKDEFAAAMRVLKRRQRAAIEKAEKAIDARKAAKLRKTIDDLAK